MKISEHIRSLQNMLDEYGDLECYYAIDEEGNGFRKTCWDGTLFYIHKNEIGDYCPDLTQDPYDEDPECNKEDYIEVCVIN